MTASALTLVAAQRLVRRNCRHCLEEYTPSEDVLLALGISTTGEAGESPPRFWRGSGCAACRNRGFLGRTAIIEMMSISPGIRRLVAEGKPASDIRHLAIEEGMKNLRTSGLEKVSDGMTTAEEILRVCLSDE